MLKYGVRNKMGEFRNWQCILSRFFVQDDRGWQGRLILTLWEKFVCQLKLVVVKFPIIRKKFMKICGRIDPFRSAMKAMAKKLKTKFSVWDQRMRRCENLANEHSLTRWEFTSLSSPGHILKQIWKVQNASS